MLQEICNLAQLNLQEGTEYSLASTRASHVRLHIVPVGGRDKGQSRGYVSYMLESETYCCLHMNVIEIRIRVALMQSCINSRKVSGQLFPTKLLKTSCTGCNT